MRGQCFEKHVTSSSYESGFYLGEWDPFLDKILRKMTLRAAASRGDKNKLLKPTTLIFVIDKFYSNISHRE